MKLHLVGVWLLFKIVLFLQLNSAFAQECNWNSIINECSIETIKNCAEKNKGYGGIRFPIITEHKNGRYLVVTNCPFSGVSTCRTTLFKNNSQKKWNVLSTVISRDLVNEALLLKAVIPNRKLKK